MTDTVAVRLRRLASPRSPRPLGSPGRRATALLLRPAPLTGLLAAGYTAATLGALLISLSVGLFGFRESISASYVVLSLAVEAITALALVSWTVLATATPRRPNRASAPGAPRTESA